METSEEFRTVTDESSEPGDDDASASTDDAPTGDDVSAPEAAGVDRLSAPESVDDGDEVAATEPSVDEVDPDAPAEPDEDTFVAPSGDVEEAELPDADAAPADREADEPVEDDSIAEDLAGGPDEVPAAEDEGTAAEFGAADGESDGEVEVVGVREIVDEETGQVEEVEVVEVREVVDEETGQVEEVEVVDLIVDAETGEIEAAEIVDAVVDEETGEVEAVDVVEMAVDPETGEVAVVEETAVSEELAEAIEEAVDEETVTEPPAAAKRAPVEAAAAEEEAPRRDPFGGPGDWYVVHTYAGYENKVKANLLSRIHSMQMEDKIFNVHIPMEDVLEIKGGKRQVVQRKVFPGYLLVKMFYDNDSWYVVRNTPGVTGFVSSGTGTKPTPLSKREVEKILAVKQETETKPQFRLEFEEGDTVRIVSGPFADFNGTVSEINVDQSKLKVLVSIFDRETPVELGFDQVAKV
jgi:transcription termination/antitermination protein NusG